MDQYLFFFCAAMLFVFSLFYLRLIIQWIVAAFSSGVVWGLVVLFIPFGVLVFAVCKWQEQRQLIWNTIVVLICLGGFFAGAVQSMPESLSERLREAAKLPSPSDATADTSKDPAGKTPETELQTDLDDAPGPDTKLPPGKETEDANAPDVKPDSKPEPGAESRVEQPREWTDTTGTYSVRATLLSVKGSLVRLRTDNGDEVELPLEKLSDDDQAYVRSHARSDSSAEPSID